MMLLEMDEFTLRWDVTPISTTTVFITKGTTSTAHAFSMHLSWAEILLSIIMGAISVVTVVGNFAVLLSYYIDKNIRQPSNYFIFSLAVSDLVSILYIYIIYKQILSFEQVLLSFVIFFILYQKQHLIHNKKKAFFACFLIFIKKQSE